MRLNWFSPLPPAKSGIADYTMRLLPALTESTEIILWTDQECWDAQLEHYAEVRPYHIEDISWAHVNRATMSVFHIGNNHRLHGNIWQISQRHPGLIVLHDSALQQLFAGLYREHWHDRAGYLQLMEYYYGAVGRQDAEDFWGGRLTIEYMVQQFPLTHYAMEHALGVLLHSPRSLHELQRESPCPLVYAPLPYPVAPHRAQTYGKAPGPRGEEPLFRLIMFGHISDNRRLVPVLQALADFPERRRFRLDVYGELWDRPRVCQHIEALGLRELVTLHDFVPAEELEAALASAHLALNLRFPTMGEASLSQLQIWDHALPSLVSRVGWYATLPPETVGFVRTDKEISDLQAHLHAFLTDPRSYVRMGEHGRRQLVTYHTPAAYVQAIANLVEDAQIFRPYSIVDDLASWVVKEMRQWTNQPSPDLGSYVWRQVGGGTPAEVVARQPLEGVENRHMEALKHMRQLLSDQSQRLQRQLSAGLYGLRRAAIGEFYPPPDNPRIDIDDPPEDMASEQINALEAITRPANEVPKGPPQEA